MDHIIATIAVYAIPMIFAITVHEAAHGYIARYFGDNTAWMFGRVTLNPIKHIDPVGTVLVPFGLLLLSAITGMGGIIFGWAKPVPINFRNLRNPKQSMIWVAAAGPGSNLVQAVLWGVLLSIFSACGIHQDFFIQICIAGISVNIILMALNLVPIPPLDGGRIVTGLLPSGWAWKYARLEPYGIYILLALILTGALNTVMRPFINLGLWIVNLFIF